MNMTGNVAHGIRGWLIQNAIVIASGGGGRFGYRDVE